MSGPSVLLSLWSETGQKTPQFPPGTVQLEENQTEGWSQFINTQGMNRNVRHLLRVRAGPGRPVAEAVLGVWA